MNKHTPGPWNKDSDGQLRGSNNKYVTIYNAGLVGVYKCEEAVANSTLIAAAPELLDALKAVISNLTEGDFISTTRLDAAKAAIEKAEGF